MSAYDYELIGGPAPSRWSGLLRPVKLAAGVLGMAVAGLSGASVLKMNTRNEAGTPPTPLMSIQDVMVKPGVPLLGVPASGLFGGKAIFLYGRSIPAPLESGASSQDGWVYGAAPYELPATVPTQYIGVPTGQSDDIVVGRLLEFSGSKFAEKLKATDDLMGYEEGGALHRGRVSVVLRDGSVREAIWYYQDDAPTIIPKQPRAESVSDDASDLSEPQQSSVTSAAAWETWTAAPSGTTASKASSPAAAASAPAAAAASSSAPRAGNLLVLGGTGFVGSNVLKLAVASKKWNKIYSLSRRGIPADPIDNSIIWITGDATKLSSVRNAVQDSKPSAVLHCIGALFDDKSGIGKLNKLVSGSGSVPAKGATYEEITFRTVENMVLALNELAPQTPVAFISAAEAGWPESKMGGALLDKYVAPDFLKRYLAAKRQAEKFLATESKAPSVNVFRPSLIWTKERPQALVSVLPFYLASPFFDFVDKPVFVEVLGKAVLQSLLQPASGMSMYRIEQIEKLAEYYDSKI
eukprot:g41583.t1